MSGNQILLHRVFKVSPEKVFRAFSDSVAYSNWLPPYGYLCTVQEMDFKVGGNYKMTFINFTSGLSHSFGGQFLEIIPNEFIRHSDRFDNSDLQGEMLTSIWFNKVMCGTEIKIIQEGIPVAIPIEMCYLGWQDSLDKLMRLVEPEISEI
jgi:uncharacterized protein YndB with AHSA1/START domain